MEIFTLDILAAVINSLEYADPERLKIIKKDVFLSYKIAETVSEELCYTIFMATMMKEMGGVGVFFDSENEKKQRPYKACEIIRTMPEIVPFQYKIADIVLENKERLDGGGYPAGKEKISNEAQIIGLSEDFVESGDIEAFIGNEKYSQFHVAILLRLIERDGMIESLNNESLVNEFFESKLIAYNVYKNELDSMENEQFLRTIAAFIDAKHKYTGGHSERVAAYSYVIAKNIGYSDEKLMELRYAAYLHDIGKLATKVDLLDKTGKLTDEEYEEIKAHAKYSYNILDSSIHLKRFKFGALHHERIDGKGYPFALKGDEIPEGAKIIAIADILDALTSNRPYRKPFTFQEAFDLMDMMAGVALDKEILEKTREFILV